VLSGIGQPGPAMDNLARSGELNRDVSRVVSITSVRSDVEDNLP
jgi:hypothetical protein